MRRSHFCIDLAHDLVAVRYQRGVFALRGDTSGFTKILERLWIVVILGFGTLKTRMIQYHRADIALELRPLFRMGLFLVDRRGGLEGVKGARKIELNEPVAALGGVVDEDAAKLDVSVGKLKRESYCGIGF